jgi:putative endonuclease
LPQRNSQNYYSGLVAEDVAGLALERRGFEVVERRWAAVRGASEGEIDIIARKDRLIVFVEVKKRATLALAAESVLPRQQGRIRASAEAFMAFHPEYAGFDCRFDAVLFDSQMGMEYLENAW